MEKKPSMPEGVKGASGKPPLGSNKTHHGKETKYDSEGVKGASGKPP